MTEIKERRFISPAQTLQNALSSVQPKFKTLYDELMKISPNQAAKLSQNLQKKCKQTFVLLNSQKIHMYTNQFGEYQNFFKLLEDCVNYIIQNTPNRSHIQSATIQSTHYGALKYPTINFGKTILEKSFFQQLFLFLPQTILYQIIVNYTIIMKYENDYVQVAGRPLKIDFNTISNIDKKKKQFQKVDPYEINIRRTLIFYCSHINRQSGIFHRNIFFDHGLVISKSKEQIKIVLAKIYQKFQISLKDIGKKYLDKLFIEIQTTFKNIRNIFSLRNHQNKQRSFFQCMLKNFCPLSDNFQALKSKTISCIKVNQSSCQDLFDELYRHSSPYSNVIRLLRNLLDEAIPESLLGSENLKVLKFFMKEFVQMKRYENLRMQDYLHHMSAFQIPWLEMKYTKKYKSQIIRRGNLVLGHIISFILNEIIIPVIKFNFYVTEQHKQANKIFYYRKPLWILISKLALFKFSQQNLQKLQQRDIAAKRQSSEHYPEGKLRILPKKGTFRPIITFNKKIQVQKTSQVRMTLQKILSNTQLVLRNMKNNLWQQLGFSVFDNRQIKKKYDEFVTNWRKEGSPKLCYFTLDIKKCYDSINTERLLEIIQKTPFIENYYFIKKYQRIYRNKRPLTGNRQLNAFFNLKQRIGASPLSKDPFIVNQNDSIPAITIFSTRQRGIARDKVLNDLRALCQGSIINYRKQSWSQNYGIPQGLNVSGVLCSLYFGTLENKSIKKHVKKGLLMRLTDDYLYLGYQDQARRVLNSLIKFASENQFKFSQSKMSKNFFHKDYPQIDDKQFIIWIGKKIRIKTLEMQPFFQKSQKIQFAMNVNLKRQNILGFMKNKLKSLLTNHFESYFKPHLFDSQKNFRIIKIFVQVSLEKFFPFLKRYFILHTVNPQLQLLHILESTIHDYVIYICLLMKQSSVETYLTVKKCIVSEVVQFFKKRKSEHEFRFIYLSLENKLKKGSEISHETLQKALQNKQTIKIVHPDQIQAQV